MDGTITTAIVAAIGGLLSGGGGVAIYRAIIEKRSRRAQLQNTDVDTELKRLQQAKTMTEMVSLLTEDLDDALKTQRTAQKDNSERLRAMQIQIDLMQERCVRVDVIEQELKLANMQLERARREGFIKRDEEDGTGPNPAAAGPDGLLNA